jgi:hypothetical protein
VRGREVEEEMEESCFAICLYCHVYSTVQRDGFWKHGGENLLVWEG